MVIHLFPGWVNAGENGGSMFVKKMLFSGSMLVVIYNSKNDYDQVMISYQWQGTRG